MNSAFQAATGIALIIIMLGMGLSLVPRNFKQVLQSPAVIALGAVNQLVVLPLVAFVLLLIFPVSPEVAIGIMIVAACPGGATSNLITNLVKADTALSICLTVISSMVTIVTIPFIVNFALQYFSAAGVQTVQLDPVDTIKKIFIVIVVPVIVGMWLKYKFPNFAERMDKPVRVLSLVFISLVVLGIVYEQRANMLIYFQQAGLIALLLNLIVMAIAYFSVCSLIKSGRDAMTVAIESGIQNGGLALLIAVSLLNNPSYAVAAIVYSLVMFATVWGFVGLLRKRLDVAAL